MERRGRFEAQVLEHLDAAYRYARWLTRSPDAADDVVQDAILRAYRSFGDLRQPDAKAWLLTIVRNCHLTALRQRAAHSFVALPDEQGEGGADELVSAGTGPEAAAMDRDVQRTLQRLMSTLPDEHREVLVLREIEDMDYRAIASVTGVPIGTVMSRLARARAALRTRWLAEQAGDTDGLR